MLSSLARFLSAARTPPLPNGIEESKARAARAEEVLSSLSLRETSIGSCNVLDMEFHDEESSLTVYYGYSEEVARLLEDFECRIAAGMVRAFGRRSAYLSSFYLAPPLRGGRLARVAWERIEKELRAQGIRKVWTHFGPEQDVVPGILWMFILSLGFRPVPAASEKGMPILELDLSVPRSAGEPAPPLRANPSMIEGGRSPRVPLRANPGVADRERACGAPSPGTARRQVPALHRAVEWRRGTLNADIGGGPWSDATRFLASKGVRNVVIDPGWQSATDVAAARARVEGGRADTATLANLLNVVPEREARREVLALAANALAPDGVAYLSVYEGDRSGRGGATRDGWQANRRLASYLREVQEFFGEAHLVGSRIEARAPRLVEAPPLSCRVMA